MANVLLRGSLESEDGFILYKGKWAFGKEGHSAKETSKFELKSISKTEIPVEEEKCDIQFEGYFVLNKKDEEGNDKKVKIKEENVKLTFTKDEEGTNSLLVSGTGKNKMGEFSLSGKFDPSSKKMQLEKAYIEEDGEFNGEDSDRSSGDDSGDSDGEDVELVDEDVADELADLKADQEAHNLVLETEASSEQGGSSRLKKGGKRIVKRSSSDSGGGGGGGGGSGGGEEGVSKKLKSESRPLPIPDTSWEHSQLQETQEKFNKMVSMNDSLGICMMLQDLSRHKITVALLQSTGIGKEVRGLKKHSDPDVSSMSEAVVNMWKEIVKLENEGSK